MATDKKRFLEIANMANNEFSAFMKENNNAVHIYRNSEAKTQGYGGFASPDDAFAINYFLNIGIYPLSISILAEDRNGNFAIDGPTAAIYTFNISEDMTDETIIKTFKTMMKEMYDKYSVYSKSNRLDFKFNELKMERKDYTPNK